MSDAYVIIHQVGAGFAMYPTPSVPVNLQMTGDLALKSSLGSE